MLLQDKNKALHDLAHEIAKHLPGWAHMPPGENTYHRAYIRAVAPATPIDAHLGKALRGVAGITLQDRVDVDAAKIIKVAEVSLHWVESDRIGAHGVMPYHKTAWLEARNRPKSITMTAKKTPEQLAKDIRRRLLPDYLPKLAVWLDRIHHADKYTRKQNVLVAEMAKAFPGGSVASAREGYFYFDGGSGSCTGDGSVTFDHVNVSREQALRIAKILKARVRKGAA